MPYRIKNPTPTQWALIGLTGAVVVGIGATAYAASRRRPRPAPAEPPIEPVAPPVEVEPCDVILKDENAEGYLVSVLVPEPPATKDELRERLDKYFAAAFPECPVPETVTTQFSGQPVQTKTFEEFVDEAWSSVPGPRLGE